MTRPTDDGVALTSMAHPLGEGAVPRDLRFSALLVRWWGVWLPLWLPPALWGAALGAGLVGLCWGWGL